MAINSITTGQYVNLRQTAASASDRIFAQLIDLGAQMMFGIAATLILIHFESAIAAQWSRDASLWLFFLGIVFPVLIYPFWVEILTGGRSLGKYVMGTRVVMVDGSTPDIGAYLLRWLMLPIDITLNLGLLFILFSERSQRLGDMTAGTMVIKMNTSRTTTDDLSSRFYVNASYSPVYPQAANLSTRQARIISDILYLHNSNRETFVRRLADKLAQMWELIPVADTNEAERLLVTALNDYYYYAAYADL